MAQNDHICIKSEFYTFKTMFGSPKLFLNLCSYGYPKNYGNYYGGNQFQNFRDFADLKKQKGDRRRFY